MFLWSTSSFLIAVLAVAALAAGWWWPESPPEGRTVADIVARIEREQRQPASPQLPAVGLVHYPPVREFTVPEAHRAWQQHRNCLVGRCPRKTAAWRVLVEARRVVPDAGRNL